MILKELHILIFASNDSLTATLAEAQGRIE